MMKIACCSVLLLSVVSLPSLADVSVNYTPENKVLSVSGELCKYGRSSKRQLPDLAIQKVHKYLKKQEVDFITQIKNVKQGMAGHRLDIAKLNLFYNLTPDNLNMDYYFEGNDSCAKFNADLMLDFEQNFEHAVALDLPTKFSFIAKSNDKKQQLAKLQDVYPELDIQVLDTDAFNEVGANNGWSLFEFDHLQYQASTQAQQSNFYVDASPVYQQAITEYLTSYGFNLVNSENDAYWKLKVSSQAGQQFAVSFQYPNSKKQTLRSQPELLGNVAADSEQEQVELIKLQLELMELVEQLQ
jgi:hypothetical protein